MRKKLLTIIICLFSIFLLCGCANINYTIMVESTGVVTQSINLQFSETDVVNAGKTLSAFMHEIEDVSNQVIQNSYSKFMTSHTIDEDMQTYSGDTVKFAQIIEFVNKNMDPNNGRPKIEWSRNGDIVYCKISLRFLNIYAYRYFYDSYQDSEKESETIREDHGYYAKDIDYSDSPFNDISNNTIAQYFMAYFDDQFAYDDISCSFTYITPNPKIYTDADYVGKDLNGNTVHTWTFTTDEITQDGKSKFAVYTVKFRAYIWYVTAIAISLFVGLFLLFICRINDYRRAKYQSHFIDSDISYFEKTSREIVEAGKKNDNLKKDS
ncbi:MAG: hypothetical protein IKR12_01345 [Clostridia bacterium]|nr:hypothetical protein [Clostridia bacterium]